MNAINLRILQEKIERKEARLAVIGLGYVGLPVACEFARAGFDVLGVEIQAERVKKINAGISPIEGEEPGLSALLKEVIEQGKLRATSDYTELRQRDVILIDVETPVDENNVPQYAALRAALRSLGPVLKTGALVIVESTVAPCTISDVVLPLLEEGSGKKVNEGFYLGNCPERVMPGKLLANLRHVGRVVGGMNPETAETMVALYRNVVSADLDPTDCITAELVKTTESAYRDVQIAFANEVALICEAVGADVWKVRELVNKSPGRQMHLPGAGVGGHCIPKDPWLLAYGAKDKDVPLRVIPAARAVNDSMPLHMVELLGKALEEIASLKLRPENATKKLACVIANEVKQSHTGKEEIASSGLDTPEKHGLLDLPRNDTREGIASLKDARNDTREGLEGKRILVMGYAYLEDSDDTRNSPSEVLIRKLRELGVEVIVHDPYVPEFQGDLLAMAQGCHAAVVMVRHGPYLQLDLAELRRVLQTPILVDGRGVFDAERAQDYGLSYHRLGQKRIISA